MHVLINVLLVLIPVDGSVVPVVVNVVLAVLKNVILHVQLLVNIVAKLIVFSLVQKTVVDAARSVTLVLECV